MNSSIINITRDEEGGDSLEVLMFSDPYFRTAFENYAVVWEKYVFSQRPDKSKIEYVNQDWREFAQRNYTSIVRCWNAWEAFKRIQIAISAGNNIERSLTLHGELANFFAMARAAIENLHEAFVDRKIVSKDDWKHVSQFGINYPNIGWIHNFRNDLLHNRLLPIDFRLPTFPVDFTLIPATRTNKSTPWDKGKGQFVPLKQVVEDVWRVFPTEMNQLWLTLDSELAKLPVATQNVQKQSNVSAGVGIGMGNGRGTGTGSGLPQSPPSGCP